MIRRVAGQSPTHSLNHFAVWVNETMYSRYRIHLHYALKVTSTVPQYPQPGICGNCQHAVIIQTFPDEDYIR